MTSSPTLLCLPTDQVALKAASLIADTIRTKLKNNTYASLGISGGSASAPLAQIRSRLGEAWSQIKLTWVDERCVPFDHPDSNRGQVYQSRALDKEQPCLYELPGFVDGEDPKHACKRVQQALITEFDSHLDVALLGMGPDGHIASLFPGHRLREHHDEDLVKHVPDSPKPPANRITMTRKMLRRSGASFLVALGDSKADALRGVLQGREAFPASHIPNLTILTNLNQSDIT